MLLKLISFFGIQKVFAQERYGGSTGGGVVLDNPLGSGTTFLDVINNILNFLLIDVSVPVLALMILIGGFQILYAKDDPAKVQSGKNTIKYAVIGFTVILCAKGVALVILNILG